MLFDFDGTLTLPGSLDFTVIRAQIGCPSTESLLDFLNGDSERQNRGKKILEQHEMRAAAISQPNRGAEIVLLQLKRQKVPFAILTRNSRASVVRSLANFHYTAMGDFQLVITRDETIPVKPDPAGVHHAARRMAVQPAEMLVVGDYIYDIEAGRRAGAPTVFLDNQPTRSFKRPEADYTFTDIESILTLPGLIAS